MDFEKWRHLSKNVSQRFQKRELKRLTIYRGEGFSVELEDADGIIDEVHMNRYSIGGNLLYSFIKNSETLKKIFVI